MARKVDKDGQPAAPQGAVGADDLEILLPDQEIEIAGRKVTVREYRFWEGLRMRAAARPFFDDLYAMFDASGVAPSFDDVSDILGRHEDTIAAMVAQSCDCDVAWVRGLGDNDGEELLVTWWMVNAGFFIRRVMRRAAQARLAPANRSAGRASTTASSPPDTSTASNSSQGSPPDR